MRAQQRASVDGDGRGQHGEAAHKAVRLVLHQRVFSNERDARSNSSGVRDAADSAHPTPAAVAHSEAGGGITAQSATDSKARIVDEGMVRKVCIGAISNSGIIVVILIVIGTIRHLRRIADKGQQREQPMVAFVRRLVRQRQPIEKDINCVADAGANGELPPDANRKRGLVTLAIVVRGLVVKIAITADDADGRAPPRLASVRRRGVEAVEARVGEEVWEVLVERNGGRADIH